MTAADDVVRTVMSAVQQVRHYGGGHPTAVQAVGQFAQAVSAGLRGAPAMRIELASQWIAVQATALSLEDRHAAQLHAHLAARRVGGLTLAADVTHEALAALVHHLALEPEVLIAAGGLAEALQAAGVTGIAVTVSAGPSETTPPDDPYGDALAVVHAVMTAVEQGGPVDVPRAALAVQGLIRASSGDRAALWPLVADRGHDELDPAHAVNTGLLTIFCGQALHLIPDVLADLGVAALLHDIGMAVLPQARRLEERTAREVGSDWRHPAEGAYLLRHLGGRESLAMLVAAEHHLPAEGETAVLPHSRLVALADYVDAMTCGRVPAMRHASPGALLSELLAGTGPAFDPVHVRVLAQLLAGAAEAGIHFTSRI